jgi:hypothetical protein
MTSLAFDFLSFPFMLQNDLLFLKSFDENNNNSNTKATITTTTNANLKKFESFYKEDDEEKIEKSFKKDFFVPIYVNIKKFCEPFPSCVNVF